MEAIRTYLENMFLNLPDTPEVRRAKEELLAMMEDKYEELKAEGKKEHEAVGIVIAEFGSLQELAADLGLTSYLETVEEREEQGRFLSHSEADKYLEQVKKSKKMIAIGVQLCIASPVMMLFLLGLSAEGTRLFGEDFAAAIGLVFLLVIVAVAVALFILYGTPLEKYEYLKYEQLNLDAGTRQYLKNMQEENRPKNLVYIVIGVALCIISAIPVCVLPILFAEDELALYGVCLLLLIVGAAVHLFILAGMEDEAYKILLQEKEYASKEKAALKAQKEDPVFQMISSVYWLVTTAIYLWISFTYNSWETSWKIWPVAGILFGALSMIWRCFRNVRKEKCM